MVFLFLYSKANFPFIQIINSIFDAIRYKEETLLGRRAASAPQGGGLGTTGRMNISEVIETKKYYKPLVNLPNSNAIYDRIICFPIHERIKDI